MKMHRSLVSLSCVLLFGCASTPASNDRMADVSSVWPERTQIAPKDPAIEAQVAQILSTMTLEQKVGQITQAEIRYITPDEAREYYIGSILNGGGSWPNMDKRASVQDWANLSMQFYEASMQTDAQYPVPVIWGTDAVHGHNNVGYATIFPHNIGLGAANDPDLTYRIGRATAKAVRATGITWVFAPTLAVVEDQRWGRTYESYSSDPDVVAINGAALVSGLQGNLVGDGDVLATAKHFLGDGGTRDGKDQGVTEVSPEVLADIHGKGYYAALDAGAGSVMASYSSWTDTVSGTAYGKMHGNDKLLTGVLKEHLQFDGILVSDWNAIEQVPGCTRDHCPQAINAGIDLFMVPEDWKAFISNTINDVQSGLVAEARIDDAVARILRVKIRFGLFDRPPSESVYFADPNAVLATDLAREAVRKSAVLIKNDKQTLPIDRSSRILVVGEAANEMSRQMGGWTVTWQGDEISNSDFRTGETLLDALREELGTVRVTYAESETVPNASEFDVIVAVVGEAAYAEFEGDVEHPASLAFSALYPDQMDMVTEAASLGIPVVTVVYSGRNLYATDLLNASDAFVAAYLPGSEAGGLVDLLVEPKPGSSQLDFSGRLPFAWPSDPCDSRAENSLFPRGYGLTYVAARELGKLEAPTPVESCDSP